MIVALFNSSPYQFLFQKKFSSIKVLRNHIEQMPLPLWDEKTFSEIIKIVNEIIGGNNNFIKLDSEGLSKDCIKGTILGYKDNKAFFEQVNIVFDSVFVKTNEVGKFRIGNLVTNLICQGLKEFVEFVWAFDFLKFEDVFIETGGGQFGEDFVFELTRRVKNFWI